MNQMNQMNQMNSSGAPDEKNILFYMLLRFTAYIKSNIKRYSETIEG